MQKKSDEMSEGKTINLKEYKDNRVKTPTVYQMEATECGAASLAMVLGYFGRFIPLEQMRIDTGVSSDGCKAVNIAKAAEKHGLVIKGFRCNCDTLFQMKPPCIIHWNFCHFLVYEGIKGGKIHLNDPACGRRTVTLSEFDEAFTGIVLTFEKGENFEIKEREDSVFKLLKRRMKGHESEVLWLLITGLILVFPAMILTVFSQLFVDSILLGGNSSWIGVVLLAMAGTLLFQLIFTWLRNYILTRLQLKITLLGSFSFLDKMLKLPMTFYEQRYTGDLVQRIENNNTVNTFITGELAETLLNIIMAVLFLVELILFSPLLTLIGVIGVAITLALNLLISKSIENISIKAQQDRGKLYGTLYSGLSITSTLKATGTENEFVSRLAGYQAKCSLTDQQIDRKGQILTSVPEGITALFNILIIMVGGILVIKGNMTAGTLVAFSQLLVSFTSPINALSGFFSKIQAVKADVMRVQDIENYELASQYKDSEDKVELMDKLTGAVELKDISFGYSILEPPFIKNFSCSITPGKTIALVGASGSGKSTIGKLISGLTDPWEGEVLFDGIPVRRIPTSIFTRSVATVSQRISLFTGTIRDNLTLWNYGAMDIDMIAAAKDACIHDVIVRQPGAYQAKVEENGDNFSGGQKQRLEIARALICNPTILVLDEATSALDPITEKNIMDNVKRRGCSCVIIAHRLSTIRDCDEIIVMDHGEIIQRGTHDEMKDVDGPYKELIKTV